jgi:hypothetical protein
MRVIKSVFIAIILGVIAASCGSSRMSVPENIVQKEELVPLLVDIHLTDAILSKDKRPHAEKYEKAMTLYPSVLLKHNIDRAVFDSTIKFYVKYPEEFAKIYDDVLRELSILEGRLQSVGEPDEDE